MKKLINFAVVMTALVCSVALVACSKEDDGPKSINHIYLSVPQDGGSAIVDGSGETVTVMVTLSKTVDTNVSFNFQLVSDQADMFVLEDNPVTIEAGKNQGFFTVKSANKLTTTENVDATFLISDLDESKFDLADNITVKLLPAPGAGVLTTEELTLIAAWKENYNIDLYPWIGNIALTGTIEFPGEGIRTPFVATETINLSGYTAFAIGKDASADTPTLDMVENPMGMAGYLYKTFRNLTIDDKEYFALEDDGSGLDLMKLINWNANSDESFAVALPGIKITGIADGKASLEFVAEGEDYILNSKGEKIYNEALDEDFVYSYHTSWIPFKYTYTAWDRQLGLVESGDAEATELLGYIVSAAPASYLGVSDVLDDEWADSLEEETINLYVMPKGEIDFNTGTMTFEFPFDHSDQYGYSRVKVTYTLNK